MNRLTYRKRDGNYSIKFDLGNLQQVDIEANNKLGHLEDIEEELGIDLITFSKVLKQKFVFNKEKIKVDLLSLFLDIESNILYIYGYIRNTFEDVRLYAKDYGKTWALTKKELEENE